MAKPQLSEQLESLRSIGKCLQGELILTPFEQPLEEERRGDIDQSDDNLNFPGNENVCEAIEDIPEYKKSMKSHHHEERFRFFLDGSIRTEYVGEYVEGGLSFPLIVSEIASAAMEKRNRRIEPYHIDKRIYCVFPNKHSNLISDSTYEKLEYMQYQLDNVQSSIRIEFLEKANVDSDIRTSLLGKVRNIMHQMEHEMAITKLANATGGGWLIMDGAIRKDEFVHLNNTIGLAKSFSRKPAMITYSLGMFGWLVVFFPFPFIAGGLGCLHVNLCPIKIKKLAVLYIT